MVLGCGELVRVDVPEVSMHQFIPQSQEQQCHTCTAKPKIRVGPQQGEVVDENVEYDHAFPIKEGKKCLIVFDQHGQRKNAHGSGGYHRNQPCIGACKLFQERKTTI